MSLTPHDIEVLLHHHCSTAPWRSTTAPAYHGSCEMLTGAGALDYADGILRTTPLGKAWVEVLCNTPCPRAAFLDEQGREVKV